ncbi:MAG: hypothetical protein NZ899_05215 [Thermoguttaceae bacterium]|nr:hypothetical protein [Thermoguttaceae bacterium]MDW8078284.1 hypothetical protein [Thermoguttaceae bacterium]
MGLTRRELVLAVVTGLLLILLAGRTVWTELFGTGRQLRQLRANLAQQVARLETRVARQKKLEAQLEAFKQRSLPGNTAVARSVYGHWLLELAKKSGWQNTYLDSGDSRAAGFYSSFRFNLKGDARWEGLARFLYGFYSADYLHRIRLLTLQPKERSDQLEVNLSVEALALEEATSKENLPERPPRSLPAGDERAYSDLLARRNIFAPYSPPRETPSVRVVNTPPPTPPPPPPFDASRFAFLTGIVGPPDQLEAWILSRTEGKTYVLREGESFQIGLLRGRIVRLELRAAEIEADGRRWRVAIGESLRPMMGVISGFGGPTSPPSTSGTPSPVIPAQVPPTTPGTPASAALAPTSG